MELLSRGVRPDLVELSVVGVNVLRRVEGKPCALEVEARRICREVAATLARRARGRG